MKYNFKALTAAALLAAMSGMVSAADYVIDTKGAHASINFKVKHMGFSWLLGRFNTFDGEFSYDEKNLNMSKVAVTIDTTSLDSNHAERDKHLKSDDFVNAGKYPKATFTSTSIEAKDDTNFIINGNFSLNGVTKPISIAAQKVGEGKDPWGGYRVGFVGETSIDMADYNFKKAWGEVLIELHVEGIKK